MLEKILVERIKFVDYLIDQNNESKDSAIKSFEAKLNLIYDAKENIWKDYKEKLESELFAQRILKLCHTGR